MAAPFSTPDPHRDEQGRPTRGLDALVDLGFDRAGPEPHHSACSFLDDATARMTWTRPAMGTRVTITAIDASTVRLTDALEDAFRAMHRLTGLFSRHDSATPLAHLNRTGRLDAPPPELVQVVRHALTFHRLTRGAFDATVAPLIALFESRAAAGTPPPADAEVREARERVGVRHVVVRRRRLGLRRPGMALTLDGIAKGGIVDVMAATLERHGVRRYLVDAGGDIRACGWKEGRQPWVVAVRDPARDEFAGSLRLLDGAVATSGSYVRRYDDDEALHHIVDPTTGRSPRHCRSATVVAPTAMAADALATSVFLMGPADGVRFIDRLAGCACLVLDRDGRWFRSRAWLHAAPAGTKETS